MKYFFDTEFNEHARGGIELISIGIAAEDGREFYAVSNEFTMPVENHWLMENVIPHIELAGYDQSLNDLQIDLKTRTGPHPQSLNSLRIDLETWVGPDPKPAFYGYFSAYDWVVLCRLFGGMLNLPPNWPKYCYDLKQISMIFGDIRFPEQAEQKHHALADALHLRDSYNYLIKTIEEGSVYNQLWSGVLDVVHEH